MKKLFSFLLVVITISITSLSFAGDRMILIEFFTSSTCGPCASNNPTMTAFVNAQNQDMLAAIGFHMNWPSPGNDPMYLFNPTDNNTRRSFYNVNSIPAGFFDGSTSISLPYSQSALQNLFDARKNILSPVTIIIRDSTYGDSVLVRVHVFCETLLANTSATMQVGVIEENIHYSSPPGTNGETDFHWVMRAMLPNANGTPISLLPGVLNTYEFRYKMNPVWVPNKIKHIAYIQSPSKEIINAGKGLLNFCLLTNPAYISVPQGQASTKNFKVKIPYVAQGFNSPVSFTAEVQPSTPGVTVSFPSGTTISNFPDSLTVQVSSTASVPNGIYKIILTGTSVSGKTHKISADFLVGQNYISMKANLNNLSYYADNTLYTGPNIFGWSIGSTHTVRALTTQLIGNTRYVFKNWSDGGDTSHNITVTNELLPLTVNYKPQFKLTSSVQPSGIPASVVGGNQFYDSSSTVTISASPFSVQYNGKTYYLNRWVGGGAGSYTGTNPTFQVTFNNPITQIAIYDTVNTGISRIGTEIPSKFDLFQNYPNPFNPSTKIKFDIAKYSPVKLEVYDITGRLIYTLVNSKLEAGSYEYSLDARSNPSGTYFYRLEAGSYVSTKRMILIK
ncbi:MAG: T9SS type A sorting domain-containing protein [Ignavibacteria bacterium]